jgi:probable rRNA maturation factor
MSTHCLHLQIASHFPQIPQPREFQQWINAALADYSDRKEITLRVVDETESATLNQRYRHKSGPTNVLSFSYGNPTEKVNNFLGDIVICASLVAQEAQEQGKSQQAHWAHLVIHGVLHLLGYDHENETDANNMEALEIAILARLKFPNPYQINQE